MRHNYYECNLCHKTDENQELRMFSYDVNNKDKYIITDPNIDDPNDIIHICICCINRIKGFAIP